MVKFGGDDSPGYKRVLGDLQRWVANLWVNEGGVTQKEGPAGNSHPTTGGASVIHNGNVSSGGVALYGKQNFQNSGITSFGGTHTAYNAPNEKEGDS